MQIFEDDSDRNEFLTFTAFAAHRYGVEILAYVLMGNHVHLLVRTHDELSGFMWKLQRDYAAYFNRKYEREGSLFEQRFRSKSVDNDQYFLAVLRYIHRNPEDAGIASHKEYRWSSYGAYLGVQVSGTTVSTELGLGLLGGVEAFKEFMALAGAVKQGDFLGIRSGRLGDDEAIALMRELTGVKEGSAIAAMAKSERDGLVVLLIKHGFSVRQLQRLTGINRGSIYAAIKAAAAQNSDNYDSVPGTLS